MRQGRRHNLLWSRRSATTALITAPSSATRSGRMEFGFSLPSRGQAATMQNMRLLAQHIEALGLDSVWVSDHIIVPRHIDSFYPYDPEGRFPSAPDQAYYEPLTTLAFLAACTTQVQLGTSVLILPYRNALLTAKIVSTLDALSGGRIILGIGVGWMEEEFDALGLDTVTVDGGIAPSTSASKPCVPLLRHTAPQ